MLELTIGKRAKCKLYNAFMGFKAETYKVLIGSPSDVSDERRVATEAIHEWNDEFAETENIVLLPVRWETHAVPETGIRPQQAINRQLVNNCDLLVAIFWTRIGSNTGVAEGGTVEEINEFISAGKPVLLYFSSRPIDPHKLDYKQHKRLDAFRNAVEQKALTGRFSGLDELREKLRRDLFRQMRKLKSGDNIAESGKALKTLTETAPDAIQHDEEAESDQRPAPSEAELLEISIQRSIRPLLEVLRQIKSSWTEQLVPSNGGSFRYWAQMQDGKRRVVCGFNVAGGRFNSDAGILDIWISYGSAIELGRYKTKENLLATFNDFKKRKYSTSRFWLALSSFAEVHKLYVILSRWMS